MLPLLSAGRLYSGCSYLEGLNTLENIVEVKAALVRLMCAHVSRNWSLNYRSRLKKKTA